MKQFLNMRKEDRDFHLSDALQIQVERTSSLTFLRLLPSFDSMFLCVTPLSASALSVALNFVIDVTYVFFYLKGLIRHR